MDLVLIVDLCTVAAVPCHQLGVLHLHPNRKSRGRRRMVERITVYTTLVGRLKVKKRLANVGALIPLQFQAEVLSLTTII